MRGGDCSGRSAVCVAEEVRSVGIMPSWGQRPMGADPLCCEKRACPRRPTSPAAEGTRRDLSHHDRPQLRSTNQ